MNKFTVIYVDDWMVGSHKCSLTKMHRLTKFEGETVLEACERELAEYSNGIVFIFQG